MNLPGEKILRKMFGLDYRSLALLRMALALVILCDLYVSAWNLRAFYTDDGVLPRTLLLSNYGAVFSFHMASGNFWFEAALFGVQAALALLMLVGYRTRLVTIASYVLVCSMQARNPILMFGVDITLRICFFWAMFLPLGSRFSLDAALGRTRPPENATYLRLPGIAYIVQFAMIYIFSGVLKTGSTWQVDHTAIYFALATEFLQRTPGTWLNQYDAVTKWLTGATLYLEKYGPLLFILPLWSGWARLLGFVVFAVFQIGINVTMWMGLFGAVMVGLMLALLPAEFWTYIAEPAGRRFVRSLKRFPKLAGWRERTADWISPWFIASARRQFPVSDEAAPIGPWLRRARAGFRGLRDGVVLFLIAYVVIWNVDTIPGRQRLIPPQYSWIARDTGLEQFFNLFAPDPRTDDGWFVIEGELQNGKTVNAFTGEPTITFDKPASVSDTYVDQRWSAYLLCLWSSDCAQHLAPFSHYLGREWNKAHTGAERMREVRITFMHEYVGPHHSRKPAVPELLWTQTFDY